MEWLAKDILVSFEPLVFDKRIDLDLVIIDLDFSFSFIYEPLT